MVYLTIIVMMVATIVLHELGHIIAIYATRAGRVTGFILNWKVAGVKWDWDGDRRKRFIVTMSGPLANILIGILLYGTEFGLLNLVFGSLNLLIPVKVADGYRALEVLLCQQQ